MNLVRSNAQSMGDPPHYLVKGLKAEWKIPFGFHSTYETSIWLPNEFQMEVEGRPNESIGS